MPETLENVIWDLNDKFQEELEKNGYMVIGNSYLQENAIIQIKKNEDVLDIGIFGGVDKEDINAIIQSEKDFDHLKDSVKLDNKNKVNELIQKYLIKRKFNILCWCVEPEPETKDYGISIGFKKGNILYSVLIAEKDFLFGQFQEQFDSHH